MIRAAVEKLLYKTLSTLRSCNFQLLLLELQMAQALLVMVQLQLICSPALKMEAVVIQEAVASASQKR
jgi:hypothetical protein